MSLLYTPSVDNPVACPGMQRMRREALCVPSRGAEVPPLPLGRRGNHPGPALTRPGPAARARACIIAKCMFRCICWGKMGERGGLAVVERAPFLYIIRCALATALRGRRNTCAHHLAAHAD